MWYIFKNNDPNICRVRCDYLPDSSDMASRNEIAIECQEVMPLDQVILVDGKVVKKEIKPPTPEEIKAKRLLELERVYEPQFNNLILAWATANLAKNNDIAVAREAEYKSLQTEYEKKRGEVVNG